MSLPLKLDFSNYDNFLTEENYTTSAEAQDYFRNMDILVTAMVDVGLWQPETSYPNGHVVFSSNMPNGAEAVCVATNGGKSSNTEPSWGEVGGDNVSDGTCFWKLRWKHWSKEVIPMENLGIEYATQAEAKTGTDNTKVMTPLRTKEAFAEIEDYINSFKPPTDNVLSIAGYHNSIYRGKYLGSALIAAQSAAIRAGTFDDMFIGDYWIINGTTYVIAAFDYYYNCGDAACTTHHITVVPLKCMYYGSMNSTNITTGAYVGSAMYTSGLDRAKNTIANDFGSDHILVIRQLFQDSVGSSGYENTVGSWVDATVWLMNEVNVYGTIIWKNAYAGTNWRGNYFVDNSQYPLFALNPRMIHIRESYWLRDVADSAAFAIVNNSGACHAYGASDSRGVRPAFNIY